MPTEALAVYSLCQPYALILTHVDYGDYGITFLEGKKISKIIIHSIIENQEQKLSLKLTLIHIINVKLSVRQRVR